jgi:2-methylfumaryl-CoA hydratase
LMPVSDELSIPVIQSLDITQTGSPYFWEDYVEGERLNHPEGMTIDSSDHTLATKLYQNNAKLHFDDHLMKSGAMGQRLMYGGHVISICRSLSFNGLGNALWLYSINAGVHANPCFGGDTIYCYSEVLEVIEHPRKDIGLLRLRTIGLKNITPEEVFQAKNEDNKYHPFVVLDLDYTVVIPRRNQ